MIIRIHAIKYDPITDLRHYECRDIDSDVLDRTVNHEKLLGEMVNDCRERVIKSVKKVHAAGPQSKLP